MTELYEKSLRKLELDNVLAQLADCANSEDGKDRCRALLPLDDAEEIRLLQQQTTAACGMIVRKGAPGFHELKPVAASLERADRGGCLTPVELLRIAGVLRCIRNVKAYYSEDGEPTVLDVYFQELSPNRYLEEKITNSILSEEIADAASSELADIRRHMRIQSAKVKDSLQKIISSPSFSKYLRDPIITLRGDRYVVPVKSEYKSEIPGLVHDVSSTGSTFFIEPMSAVNANNALRELLTQEHIPLRLYSGAEVFADPSNIRTLIEQHELITLGGSRYLLVEFDFGLPGSVLLRTLEAIAQRGLVPVVAHPERYDAVQRDPGLAAWCFSRGMLLQLNKGSLLGLLGSRAEDTALHLLSHGLAHLIASDAHDDRFRTTGFRSLLPVLEPICHPDYIALLLHGNPRRILRDEPIPIPPLQSD